MLGIRELLSSSMVFAMVVFVCFFFPNTVIAIDGRCSDDIYSLFEEVRSAAKSQGSDLYYKSINRRAFRERVIEISESNKMLGNDIFDGDEIEKITDNNIEGFRKVLLDIKFVKAYAEVCNGAKAELFLAALRDDSDLYEVVLSLTKVGGDWKLDGVSISDYSFVVNKSYDELVLDVKVVSDDFSGP